MIYKVYASPRTDFKIPKNEFCGLGLFSSLRTVLTYFNLFTIVSLGYTTLKHVVTKMYVFR